jgi:hypothetical protein
MYSAKCAEERNRLLSRRMKRSANYRFGGMREITNSFYAYKNLQYLHYSRVRCRLSSWSLQIVKLRFKTKERRCAIVSTSLGHVLLHLARVRLCGVFEHPAWPFCHRPARRAFRDRHRRIAAATCARGATLAPYSGLPLARLP